MKVKTRNSPPDPPRGGGGCRTEFGTDWEMALGQHWDSIGTDPAELRTPVKQIIFTQVRRTHRST